MLSIPLWSWSVDFSLGTCMQQWLSREWDCESTLWGRYFGRKLGNRHATGISLHGERLAGSSVLPSEARGFLRCQVYLVQWGRRFSGFRWLKPSPTPDHSPWVCHCFCANTREKQGTFLHWVVVHLLYACGAFKMYPGIPVEKVFCEPSCYPKSGERSSGANVVPVGIERWIFGEHILL
jgi:hypothetical protein